MPGPDRLHAAHLSFNELQHAMHSVNLALTKQQVHRYMIMSHSSVTPNVGRTMPPYNEGTVYIVTSIICSADSEYLESALIKLTLQLHQSR